MADKSFQIPISLSHPIITHYTDTAGLLGILDSGNLWATHSRALNDLSENTYVRPYLHRAIEREARKIANGSKGALGPAYPNSSEADIVIFANVLINRIFEMLFGTGGALQNFVVSFCGTSGQFSIDNGLLNMWQGYGRDGGYAFEFESDTLWKIAEKWGQTKQGFTFFLTVVYGEGSKGWSDLEKKIDGLAARFVSDFATNNTKVDPTEIHEDNHIIQLVRCSLQAKHPSFSVEQEVRLSVSRDVKAKPNKQYQVRFRQGRFGPVPYVELFGNHQITPALRQIVVGPHPQSEYRVSMLKMLAADRGLNISVRASEIPYAGII